MAANYQTDLFFNAMPHAFNFYSNANDAKADPPVGPDFGIGNSGSIARLVEQPGKSIPVDPHFAATYAHGFPPSFGGVTGVPSPDQLQGRVLIVSMLVGDYYARNPEQARATGALHIVGPDSGAGAVRDAKGVIVGTTKFVVYA
jgi:hypothetical protein